MLEIKDSRELSGWAGADPVRRKWIAARDRVSALSPPTLAADDLAQDWLLSPLGPATSSPSWTRPASPPPRKPPPPRRRWSGARPCYALLAEHSVPTRDLDAAPDRVSQVPRLIGETIQQAKADFADVTRQIREVADLGGLPTWVYEADCAGLVKRQVPFG